MPDQGNTPPENGSNGDEPTRAYQPVHDDAESTRLERPIRPYDEESEPVSATILPPGYREYRTNVALLIAVALLSILVGIGLGYLLFHGSSDESPTTTTTTVVTSSSTTTEQSTTTTEAARTTTTVPATTTTRAPTTTTATPRTTTTQGGATTLISSPLPD